MKKLLLLGVALLLTACGTPDVSTPGPTPQAIEVVYPVAIKPWADKLAECAATNPSIALYFTQSLKAGTSFDIQKVILRWGQPGQEDESSYISQVGWEQLIVVVNHDNAVANLSTSELRSIFSGQTTQWDDNSAEQLQVWVLPVGDPSRVIFDQSVMASSPLTTEARLAPDPQAMLEAISSDVNSIGFLPEKQYLLGNPTTTSKVKLVQLEEILKDKFRQPVLAITPSEPQGAVRELLVCLQARLP
jgi:hypothetical protein